MPLTSRFVSSAGNRLNIVDMSQIFPVTLRVHRWNKTPLNITFVKHLVIVFEKVYFNLKHDQTFGQEALLQKGKLLPPKVTKL